MGAQVTKHADKGVVYTCSIIAIVLNGVVIVVTALVIGAMSREMAR